MDLRRAGQAGLQGWRKKVGDRVAPPVARHSRWDDEQVRAAVGALFFALALIYVVQTIRRLVGAA